MSRVITRDLLRQITPNHEGIRYLEGLGQDLIALDSRVSTAQADADAAQATANAAQRALTQATVTGTSGAIAAAVNTLYVADMSGWTADRTLTLPAVSAVGDRVGLVVLSGDADYEWLITAAAGDTLRGVAGGTEWSRLFITGEVIVCRCVEANTAWAVEIDGRIPQQALMALTTNATGEAANTYSQPTALGGAWTARTDNASLITTASGQIKTRRAGSFRLSVYGKSVTALAVAKFYSAALYLNGTAQPLIDSTTGAAGQTTGQPAGAQADAVPLAVDDFVVYQFRSEEGAKGLTSGTLPELASWASLTETL